MSAGVSEQTHRVAIRGLAKDTRVTAREAEVLSLISRHLTNAQISEELFISVRTVESHVSALLRKLQLPDRRSLERHAEFAATESTGYDRGTLPRPATRFIGRAAERAQLTTALAEHRLVTATGPGGVGKTRLAVRVASDLIPLRRHGGWFVDLVHVSDPAMVMATIAQIVGVPEQRSTPVDAALVATLTERDSLLVLDNCEHLLDGVRDCVERVVAGCPHVTILATSRARLMLPYERVVVVSGLSVTDDGGDAVELFRARIETITGEPDRVDARRVAALCRALDGIALAIELAAARYPTVGLDGLEAGLDERLRLFAAGSHTAHDRHQSLRDAVDWSYDLLTSGDKWLLSSVGVFASWFDVDAAACVAGLESERAGVADSLGRLADDSLLVVERGERTRYRALETIRQYGVERLDAAGELVAVRARHEQWCRGEIAALDDAEPDDAWRARFDLVVDDLRAALVWAASDESGGAQAAELAAGLAALLFLRGRSTEAQHRYEQSAQLEPTMAGRADYLRMAAGAASSRQVGNEALRLLRAAADAAIEVGDRAGAACDLAWMSIYVDRFPGFLAERPRPEEVEALRDEARTISDGSARAVAAITLATVTPLTAARSFGGGADHPATLESVRHAVEVAGRAGDRAIESAALDQLSAAYLALDDLPDAVLAIRRRGEVISELPLTASTGLEYLDYHHIASDVYLAAGDLVAAGDHADALARLPFVGDEDHLALSRRLRVGALAGRFDEVTSGGERFRLGWERAGRPIVPYLGGAAYAVAMVHGILGDDDRRTIWLRLTVDLGYPAERLAGCVTGWAPTFDAILALHRDDPDAAVERLSVDLDDRAVWGFWNTALWRPWYAAVWAEAAVMAELPDAARRIEHSRPAARSNPIAATIIDRADAILTGDADRLGRCAVTFTELHCEYQRARTEALSAAIRSSRRS